VGGHGDARSGATEQRRSSFGGGAGIQAAQTVANRGVEAVITGQIGPNAVRVLNSAGIAVYVGASGWGQRSERVPSGESKKAQERDELRRMHSDLKQQIAELDRRMEELEEK
jgi:predicted Fe-Mo cluster-binding NifX family protein